jgi:arylformamidase
MSHSPAWYDGQYNNRANIPEHPGILRYWAEASEEARRHTPGTMLDLHYGSGPGEGVDVFGARTGGAPAPVLVWIHGGYWRALSKSDHSLIAPPLVQAGAVVVVPDYALAPAVTVEHIVLQIARALAWTWREARRFGADPSRIVVGGHSAGGHLAAMMLACRWGDLAADLPGDMVRTAVSLSGVFDLEPLRHAPFLAGDLGLDAAQAKRLSPACFPAPQPPRRLIALVGQEETPEFHRQNRLIRRRWGADAVPVCEAVAGCHHMSILHTMVDAQSRTSFLTRQALGLAR